MQFIKIIKNISLLSLILLFSLPVLSQKDIEEKTEISSDTSSIKKERKRKPFSFLKKKKKKKEDEEKHIEEEDDYDNEEPTDTIENSNKKKKGIFSFLKKKNKNDSISGDSINNATDSIKTKKRFSWLKKNKNDSAGGAAKPDKIKMRMWNSMNAEEQDSVFKAWDDYDKKFYKEKYAFTKKEVKIALKLRHNFWERLIYKKARKKPENYKRKIINRQNNRYQKTMRYERFKKGDNTGSDTISDARKYKMVNNEYKRGAKREAIRKNKTLLKYDRKENRLRRKYELSEKEKLVLTKGRGIRLRGSEKITFKKARKKQEKFTEKIVKIRKERSFALQSKNVQDRMKKNQKKNKKRDKRRYNRLFKKKKKKKYNKHDSDEFPKRYHK